MTLVGTAAAVHSFSRSANTLRNLVNLKVVRGCECCDRVLTHLPPTAELMRLHSPLIHPRILEESVRMRTLMKFESEGVRLSLADQDQPVDVLTLESNKRRLPWVILPAHLPRDLVLTKQLAIKVEHVVEVQDTAKEMATAMQAIAVVPVLDTRNQKVMPVDVIMSKAVRPHVVDGLCAMLDGFERGGFVKVSVTGEKGKM
ncbi:hypothetical protein AMAG_05882 [Allomyces macrogynus ATCC 38327]|uniref:Uncharacterized protein n=1 Tax=Allomyces macrogynus (strain ATCC 38327) TaxID=578462 RepID=A0A0L0SDJ6_ALLM3|nr:hypothetical protein AMAG_05882 [Allomyces macrogynus ATCC 38327]|eukprot:KNE60499.1 hypothetical protein AMAG_05882 [Allomyces macrogynus ATCC 38327]